MKFLCLKCDEPMKLTELQRPGDQTMTVAFECACWRPSKITHKWPSKMSHVRFDLVAGRMGM